MTERRLKILTDAGFPFSVEKKAKKDAKHQDKAVFDAKPWLEKYKDFLLYIAAHGSLEALPPDLRRVASLIYSALSPLLLSSCPPSISSSSEHC